MEKKICALIVTYNRAKYLKQLLEKMVNQTRKVDSIFIFDNFSNDNTRDIIKEIIGIEEIEELKLIQRNKKDINYYYYRNESNTGGAGGFSKAMKIIHNLKRFDFLWIMDDDVLPDDDCLEKLLEFQNSDRMITIPNRSDSEYEDKAIIEMNMSNPFKIFMKRKKIVLAHNLKEECTEVYDMSFEGPLINSKLIDKIGYPDPEYFIQFDDTDYATRSIKYTTIGFIKNATLHKQIIISTNTKRKYMDWKDYYAYRNDIIYCKKYGKNIFVKNLTPILMYIDMICRAIIKRKWKNIRIMNKAFKDGWNMKAGKIVTPGEF